MINVLQHFVRGTLTTTFCYKGRKLCRSENRNLEISPIFTYFINHFRCVQKNLGREQFDHISNSEEWSCLICTPTQIYKHKALYYSLYRFNLIFEGRRSEIKEKRRATSKQKSDILSTKAQHILKSSNNFIEENIGNIIARMWNN